MSGSERNDHEAKPVQAKSYPGGARAALWITLAAAILVWLEGVAVARIVHHFGLPAFLSLYLLPASIGIGVVGWRYRRIRARWEELDALHPPDPGDVFAPEVWRQRWKDSLALGCTVLFLLIPGPLTSVAAFYLLLRIR